MTLPEWRLPPGVTRGAWDYAQSRLVAEDYDEYHADNTLFEFEEQVLREEFSNAPAGGVIADFGCGTGRALVPLCREGWRGLAIDLSEPMLDVVRQKADVDGLDIECVSANLVEMGEDLAPDATADHGMCLFSTLGMIRGRKNRALALNNIRRVLKPGGRLVLHVHNFWFNLYDPGGPWWVAKSLASGIVRRPDFEVGDKVYPYRGVPNFFLHVFRAGELRADLRAAGLSIRRWLPLDVSRRHLLSKPWCAPSLRANGWIVVGERD